MTMISLTFLDLPAASESAASTLTHDRETLPCTLNNHYDATTNTTNMTTMRMNDKDDDDNDDAFLAFLNLSEAYDSIANASSTLMLNQVTLQHHITNNYNNATMTMTMNPITMPTNDDDDDSLNLHF